MIWFLKMFSKRGAVIVLLLSLLIFISTSYVHACDLDPECAPKSRSCGCGGLQFRHTLCDGGCSDWLNCNVTDIEVLCADGIDDDCDGSIDCADTDCITAPICIDEDADSYSLAVDCDDTDPAIHPGVDELCNLVDDDCDGTIDEGCTCTPAGRTKACGTDTGECAAGTQTCLSDGTWGACSGLGPVGETCDGVDNDCDGQADEGCDCLDGESRDCGTATGVCELGSQICVTGHWDACKGGILPAEEVCGNSLDDNCDGLTDEKCPGPEPAEPAPPASPANITSPEPTSPEPEKGPEFIVTARECIDFDGDGYGLNCKKEFDCDDSDAARNPGAGEVCNGIDDDCNNIVDEHLSRGCGVSDVGRCTLGNERCFNGVWSGCTAVLPSEEVCNNGLDDNCDSLVDEGCDQVLSEEELALRQFFDIKEGRGNYDWDHYLERHRATKGFINVKKSSAITDGKTTIKIQIIPVQTLHDLTVFEYIPKFVTRSADNIIFSTPPEIIQADPLVAWHFDELSERADLSYEIEGEVEGAAAKTSTITFAEDSSPKTRPWYFDIMPLMIIPVLGFVFIFLVEFVHNRKK
jgi:hypothetical protein